MKIYLFYSLLTFLLCPLLLQGQDFSLRGQVVDETGQVLEGAYVLLKKQRLAVFSDEQGSFAVMSKLQEDTLLISALGYRTYQVVWNNTMPLLRCQLQEQIIELSSVEIRPQSSAIIGYEGRAKKYATYSPFAYEQTVSLVKAPKQVGGRISEVTLWCKKCVSSAELTLVVYSNEQETPSQILYTQYLKDVAVNKQGIQVQLQHPIILPAEGLWIGIAYKQKSKSGECIFWLTNKASSQISKSLVQVSGVWGALQIEQPQISLYLMMSLKVEN
jgi:hypothetical protein